jgi:hypothetical protein
MKKILSKPDCAELLIKHLEQDIPWCKYSLVDGDVYEETDINGEEMFKKFNHKVLFKKSCITVLMDNAEYSICSKNKFWADEDYDGYNSEITRAFFDAWDKGIL